MNGFRTVAASVILLAAADAGAQPALPATSIVQFNTVCADCHEAECSGRLGLAAAAGAARSHIERYLGPVDETLVTHLFAMLRHVKETCRHYPALPVRPATGAWQAEELAPWRNPYAGAYFVPLGTLAPGRRELALEFDRPAEGGARIHDERIETRAEEELCGSRAGTLAFDARAGESYFLHLKSGAAILRRIVFR